MDLETIGKLTHPKAKTLDPNTEIDILAGYEFLDRGHILLIKDYFNFGKQLIETSERVAKWTGATLVNDPSNIYLDPKMRSSKNMTLSAENHQDFAPFERVLEDAFHACVKLYLYRNTFAKVSADTGYELLKYGVGDQFGEHVDIIPGHPQWGYRRISAVLYLNDNYEGGELKFTRQEITIKPPAGSIVLFPSEFTYPHTSLPVTSGTKYSVVTWFT